IRRSDRGPPAGVAARGHDGGEQAVIVALDQSTRALGWCQMRRNGEIVNAGSQRFRGERAEDRVPLVMAFASKMFADVAAPATVALERAWLARGGKANAATLDLLAELRGRLIGAAQVYGHDVRL